MLNALRTFGHQQRTSEMPISKSIAIKNLHLDLNNYRTVTQESEASAVEAMIALKPERFWGLMRSLLADGYHPTENIIVLKENRSHVVKEGNRRIACLKIALGYFSSKEIAIPDEITDSIQNLSRKWKSDNKEVPCLVYAPEEESTVDKLITMTHGKGEIAGRDAWNAVAKARHNREKQGRDEPGLDLLEKYLEKGRNLTQLQRERWGGDYALSTLNEAISKIAERCGTINSKDLAEKYPKIKFRNNLEQILFDIGSGTLTFKDIRSSEEFGELLYGFPKVETKKDENINPLPNAKTTKAAASTKKKKSDTQKKQSSAPLNSEKSVIQMLKDFNPRGANRSKIVTLTNEAKTLKISKHPFAFCFLIRSIVELSAKAYCSDHKKSGGPAAHEKNGNDKKLVNLLRDVTKHLTNNEQDKMKLKELHGAMTELAKNDNCLSVTSMNHLVHNSNFTISQNDICTSLTNLFPLIEAMNS
ncbi:MAG: hypothetical protein R3C11_17355 [Planctomycetaceae bacterium]